MVYAQIRSEDARVCGNIAERPNTVICLNGIVSKVKEGLTANVAPKHSVSLILEIVLFVILLVRVNLCISKVKSEVKEVPILQKIFFNFIR